MTNVADRPLHTPEHLLLHLFSCAPKDELCLLHEPNVVAGSFSSDVDVLATPDAFKCLLESKNEGWLITQCIRHEFFCYALVFVREESFGEDSLILDVALHDMREGRVFYCRDDLLPDLETSALGLPILARPKQFAYYLTKRVAKLSLDTTAVDNLREIWKTNSARCLMEIRRFFPNDVLMPLVRSFELDDRTYLNANLPTIRSKMRQHMISKDPLGTLMSLIREFVRSVERVRYPTGLFISIFGPDGAGKSSLIRNVDGRLRSTFRSSYNFHLRPGVLSFGLNRNQSSDPHSLPFRSSLFSLAKLVVWTTDYIVGYFVLIRPKLLRSGLVLSDRYFHDIFVDPIRYRYGWSRWVLSLFSRFIPNPDLVLILDAPIETILERKQEVSRPELARQLIAYRKLGEIFPSAFIINAGVSETEVACACAKVILTRMADVTKARIGRLI
jgi:thymidylate kinase